MNKENLKRGISAAAEEISQSPDLLYYVTIVCYILSVFAQSIQWALPIYRPEEIIRQTMIVVVLLAMGIQIAAALIYVSKKRWMAVPSVLLAALFCFFCAGLKQDQFDIAMVLFLVLFSYGRNYRRTVQVFFGTMIFLVVTAAAGLLFQYTWETPKVGPYGVGYSFGFVYSNRTGAVLLLILLSGWYLFLKKRRWVTFLFFWPAAVFLFFVIRCRTAALLAAMFPVMWVLFKHIPSLSGKAGPFFRKSIKWLLIAIPFLCFALTVFLGSQAEALVKYTYGTAVENMSMRFVQSGLAFQEYGFPLTGRRMLYSAGSVVELAGVSMRLKVMDNAYSSYAILRGMIYLTALLAWIAYVQWKAIKRRDYALLLVSVLLCIYGLMERWGLDIYYNFALFYPLAAIGGTKADAGPAGSGEKEDAP